MGALLTSILFVLTLPPFDIYLLIYIALIPYFTNTVHKKTTQVFVETWLIGLSIGLYAYLGALFESPWLYLACIFIISTVFALIGYLSARIVYSKIKTKFVYLGMIWALPEVAFDAIDLPFSFAVGLVSHVEILQSASYIGVSGVVALLFICQAGLAHFFRRLSRRYVAEAALGLSTYVLLIVTLHEVGLLVEQETRKDVVVVDRVIAVQTAFEPDLLDLVGLPGNIEKISNDVINLVNNIEKYPRKATVIWPESSLPGVPMQIENDIVKATYSLDRKQVLHAYGVNSHGETESRAWLIDGDGRKLDSYTKTSPVPFVEEYKGADTLPRPLVGDAGNIGVLICNDSSFFRNYKTFVKSNADYVVVLTNDAYAGPSILAFLHLALEQIRAVESGLAIVRSANGGPSAIIGVTGRVEYNLPLFKTGIITASIEKLNKTNFYVKYADLFTVIYWLILLSYTIKLIYLRGANDQYFGEDNAKEHIWTALGIISSILITVFQFYTVKSQYTQATLVINRINEIKPHVPAIDFVIRDLGFITAVHNDQGKDGKDILSELVQKGVVRLGDEQPAMHRKFKHEYGLLKTKLGDVVLLQDSEGEILLYSEKSGGVHRTNYHQLKYMAESPVTWVGMNVKNTDSHIN